MKIVTKDDFDYGIPESNGKSLERCYRTHPPLPLGTVVVYGGSCSDPVVRDANIYVGLDSYMAHGLVFPWQGGVELSYPITDMTAPKNPETFRQLIDWLCKQLHDGKKVHVGCIGGHGRTGTVLAALTKVILDEPDAIQYVREQYCDHAVESAAQVNFLHQHFGITKVKGYKEFDRAKSVPHTGGYIKPYDPTEYAPTWIPPHRKQQLSMTSTVQQYDFGTSGKSKPKGITRIDPAKSPKSIWGAGI